ncbi:MAG: hypothetical protein ACOYL9_11810 [Ilumatobacteraceae bacterium]|jgi:hypothetical protein
MRPRAVCFGVVVVVAAGLFNTGCATTYDKALVADTSPSTTTSLPTGSATELLGQMRTEAFGLSSLIVDGGDDTAAAERIAVLWKVAKPEVQRERSDLVDGFDQAVAMCQRAVQFRRGADADKAARNIDQLVTAFDS